MDAGIIQDLDIKLIGKKGAQSEKKQKAIARLGLLSLFNDRYPDSIPRHGIPAPLDRYAYPGRHGGYAGQYVLRSGSCPYGIFWSSH